MNVDTNINEMNEPVDSYTVVLFLFIYFTKKIFHKNIFITFRYIYIYIYIHTHIMNK